MDAQKLMTTVHAMFQGAFERGDFTALKAHVSPTYVDHSPIPPTGPGGDGFAGRIANLRSAFGDLKMTIHHMTVDGNLVWFRWTLAGKHVGTFNGIAPTGKPISMDGINCDVFDGDQLVENFSQFDRVSLMAQVTG